MMAQDMAIGEKACLIIKLKRKERTLTRNRQLHKDDSLNPRIEAIRVEIKELTQEVTSSSFYKQLIAVFLLTVQSLSMGYNTYHEDHRLLRPARVHRGRRQETVCTTLNLWEE